MHDDPAHDRVAGIVVAVGVPPEGPVGVGDVVGAPAAALLAERDDVPPRRPPMALEARQAEGLAEGAQRRHAGRGPGIGAIEGEIGPPAGGGDGAPLGRVRRVQTGNRHDLVLHIAWIMRELLRPPAGVGGCIVQTERSAARSALGAFC